MNEEREERPNAPFGAPTGEPLGNLAAAIGSRNLLVIIVTMPLVFLIVVMATISIFGSPADRKDAAAASEATLAQPMRYVAPLEQPAPSVRQGVVGATAASTFGSQSAPLVLPRDAKIGAMALDGDRLALRVDGESGGEIVIYDLALGATIQRIRITPQQSVETSEGL